MPRHTTVGVKQKGSSARHHTFITCTAQFTRTHQHDKPSTALNKWRVQGRNKTHTQKPIEKKQMCFCLQAVELDNRRMAKFVSFNFTLVSLQANMKDAGMFNNLKPRHRQTPTALPCVTNSIRRRPLNSEGDSNLG